METVGKRLNRDVQDSVDMRLISVYVKRTIIMYNRKRLSRKNGDKREVEKKVYVERTRITYNRKSPSGKEDGKRDRG